MKCPRTTGSFFSVLLLGALLLGACEPSAGTGEADSTNVDASSTEQRGTQQADSLADRLIARSDSAFETIEVLSAREKRRLRRYLQNEHLARARRLGLAPVRNRRAAANLMSRPPEESGAVQLQTNDFYIIDPRMGYAVPLVVPSAAHLLERIGWRFQQDMLARGLPPYRFILTNVLRTGIDQAHLRGTNVNAAQGQSTHEYGTTFDIYYERFHYAAVHDSLAQRASRRSPTLDEARLRQRLRRAYLRFGTERAQKIKAVLGRTLLQLQDENLLLATYERQQPVFHLTVAREVEALPNGGALGTPGPTGQDPPQMTAEMRRFYANTESQLSDIDNDISDLKQQTQRTAGEAQQNFKRRLSELQGERDRLQQELSRLEAVSPSAFQTVKPDLQQSKAELQGNVERTRIEAMQQNSEVRSYVYTRTQEMDRAISQLEGQVENAGPDVKDTYRQRVSDLRAQLGVLESQLEKLRNVSGQEFLATRSDVADAVTRLSINLEVVSGKMTGAVEQEG